MQSLKGTVTSACRCWKSCQGIHFTDGCRTVYQKIKNFWIISVSHALGMTRTCERPPFSLGCGSLTKSAGTEIGCHCAHRLWPLVHAPFQVSLAKSRGNFDLTTIDSSQLRDLSCQCLDFPKIGMTPTGSPSLSRSPE